MNTLPQELLARILSFLPLNSEKELLSKVSRQFFDALLLPAAHDNWSFPLRFPLHHMGAQDRFSDPNSPDQGYRCLCPYLCLRNTADTAGIIPHVIKKVYLHTEILGQELQLDECPVLANVKVLSVVVDELFSWLKVSRVFPNVEVLQVYDQTGDNSDGLKSYLSQLSNLRWLEVFPQCDITCALPLLCKLVISIYDDECPVHVRHNVVALTVKHLPDEENPDTVFDMKPFADFPQLQYVRIEWHVGDIFLVNMRSLPKHVSRVRIAGDEERFYIGWSSDDLFSRTRTPGVYQWGAQSKHTLEDAEWAARIFTPEEEFACAYELTRQI